MISKTASTIFKKSIKEYHILDDVNQPFINPYKLQSLENILFRKGWIDTVQWHYEDLIRDPKIHEKKALLLKRKIDASNQDRTETVEGIDNYFLKYFKNIKLKSNARINTESPAWAIDRLSILELKIYHMREETNREDTSSAHQKKCKYKLEVLIEQNKDLCSSVDQLLEDISNGLNFMKVYKQMKMYNDENLNPILYRSK